VRKLFNWGVDMCKVDDLEGRIDDYFGSNEKVGRYRSFDFCYNYFRSTHDVTENMEVSCAMIASYLASWGMYRGKAQILQHSYAQYIELIEYIQECKESNCNYWGIDVNVYNDVDKRECIVDNYKKIKEKLSEDINTHLTLITKIQLGVFGFIPAIDTNFSKAMKNIFGENHFTVRRLTKEKVSFDILYQFYRENEDVINRLSEEIRTVTFIDNEGQSFNYPKAKIIDMYGFNLGEELSKDNNPPRD
jgi:hypothetical protein